jgi:very-short-patch-repair endonuclease
MQALHRTVEEKLAAMASASYGVVTRQQLLVAGISRQEIWSRLQRGDLLREHRGVYRVGHQAPNTEATYLAAVLAAGDGALLCGRAAVHLWGLLKGVAPTAEVITSTERRIKGVRTRRSRSLDAQDAATCRGIPVTSVPRTVVDVAAVLSESALARACHEAGVRYGLTPNAVVSVLARRPRTKGARKLRQVIEGDIQITLSKLEGRFLQLLREERLPLPVMNRPAGGRRVDCRWPEYRLTVELDGYQFHNSRHAWEQDRRREREARARGDDFRRFTYGDVFEHPTLMLAELRTVLSSKIPG